MITTILYLNRYGHNFIPFKNYVQTRKLTFPAVLFSIIKTNPWRFLKRMCVRSNYARVFLNRKTYQTKKEKKKKLLLI